SCCPLRKRGASFCQPNWIKKNPTTILGIARYTRLVRCLKSSARDNQPPIGCRQPISKKKVQIPRCARDDDIHIGQSAERTKKASSAETLSSKFRQPPA